MSEDRLQRVEEAVGFGERATEELAAEVLRLARRLLELSKRVDALERRMEDEEES